MATIKLRDTSIHTSGELPPLGSPAKDFELVTKSLARVSLKDYTGTRLVLNVFPSLDTGTCAASVRYFNQLANDLPNTRVLCISRDTPFAQSRFCGAEGLDNVVTLSDFETGKFGKDYGLQLIDGPMKGFFSRVVIIVNADGNVEYTQQVPVLSDEPDYDEVVAALK